MPEMLTESNKMMINQLVKTRTVRTLKNLMMLRAWPKVTKIIQMGIVMVLRKVALTTVISRQKACKNTAIRRRNKLHHQPSVNGPETWLSGALRLLVERPSMKSRLHQSMLKMRVTKSLTWVTNTCKVGASMLALGMFVGLILTGLKMNKPK